MGRDLTEPSPIPSVAPSEPGGRPRGRSGRARFTVLVLLALLAVGVAVWGWYLAFRWQDRAETAEAEFRQAETALLESETDVEGLESRQDELAAEKAAAEDKETALEAENEQLLERTSDLSVEREELVQAVRDLSQVAARYRQCAGAYESALADVAAGSITAATQATVDRAVSLCRQADALAQDLSP